jgi:hypothetical protein
MTRKAAPWVFSENAFMKTWIWKTPHFETRIISSPAGDFTWKVVDITGSEPNTIGTSEVQSFQDAEDEVLEVIGKSYPRKLGYQAYAGDLATTFTLHNGQRIDLGRYYGQNVILTVFNKKSPMTPHTIAGILTINFYKVLIKTDTNSQVSIPPEYIMQIRKEYDSTNALIEETKASARVNEKRIIQENWRPGCTGQAGFKVGTIIHSPSDDPCPFHD